jgi:hypothetical protein
MSKFGLIIGLIFSVVLHAWLFRYGVSAVDTLSVNELEQTEVATAMVDVAKIAKSHDSQNVEEVAVNEPEPVVEKVESQPERTVAQLPELVESGKRQVSNQDQSGDFAGHTDGVSDPVVRINWGDLKSAVSILDSSGMKLVIYESGGSVKKQVVIDGSTASIKPLHIDQTISYSDSLRIVDNVPAFAAIINSLKIPSADHLAVLVPVNVERIIESAKITEVSRRSLSLRDVKILGGRFNVADGKVIFIIEKVLLRS